MSFGPIFPNIRSFFDPLAIAWAAIFWGIGEAVKFGYSRRQANRKTSNEMKVLESLQLALLRIYQDGNLKDARPELGENGLYHVSWNRAVPPEIIAVSDSVKTDP